ncbi:hypothetical protein BOTBODRAFT_159018 [Botryobasidium botryosum FD-172 SS1]|uniref:Actin-like ATPase domain-containing protein n=1 Tax=Botryobasidium botryosum (strain FD-172 SS1) TaxID=930990 RepID=A0A067MJR6_BOTB1|nr:hypothetical protein BOTBODRAFT_159018 [Botryobasidium botryosum FD-172 SS1]
MSVALPSTPARLSANPNASASSPHYTTTRRHSLYGTEDRIILDPGSRVWKVGFSGEGKPRAILCVAPEGSLWNVESFAASKRSDEREEEERVLEHRIQDRLRSVFLDSLLTDPKSRKVIVVEHPLMPLHVKEKLARILFRNIQVPSLSFAPSHLLALLASGRMSGLVLDSGHLESTVLPIYASRPLFPLLRTTPIAGARLTSHLRNLILAFGTYRSPPPLLGAPIPPAPTRVALEILTPTLLEEIKARCCFVGESISGEEDQPADDDDAMSLDVPPSSDTDMAASDAEPPSDVFSSIVPISEAQAVALEVERVRAMYSRHTDATDLHFRVVPPGIVSHAPGASTRGTLVIPGWVRERAAELLFEGGDVDEKSVAEVILDTLLKVPVDLRKDLVSSILVVGGTAMLPGFIPRLYTELARLLSSPASNQPSSSTHVPSSPPSSSPPQTPTAARTRILSSPPSSPSSIRRPRYDPYAPLRPLAPFISILNNPVPPLTASSTLAGANAGKAPAFAPAILPWVGGSLAGALKTGGEEILRERWDEAFEESLEPPLSPLPAVIGQDGSSGRRTGKRYVDILPDWTRIPLSVGAPSVALDLSSALPPGTPI